MPNLFAHLMLLIWPLVMVVLFKKLPADKALVWSFLGAFMLLPPEVYIDLPLVPTLNKYTLPSMAAFLLCMIMTDQKIRLFPASKVISLLMMAYVLSPLVTVMTNREPLFYAHVYLPGMTVYDAISEILKHAITIIPFILGFNFISNPTARRNFLTAFMIAGLIYSIPILLEVRLSPQINNWVYGYFPGLFGQQIRFGGYRPTVFMGHGLVVAYFILMAVLSAAILFAGSKGEERSRYFGIFLYLLVILILCKTVAAVLYAIMLLPIIMFCGPRIKGWVVLVCSILVLAYPVLRAADAVPVDRMLEYAALIQAERAQSLGFRFDNEKELLDHAGQKSLAGWGYWNRNRVFDPETGRNLYVPDGYWIVILGTLGWVGYICIFGLLTVPLIRMWKLRNRGNELDDSNIIYGIGLMLAINLVDLIPNSAINYMTWLLAGLLLSYVPGRELSDVDVATKNEPVPEPVKHKRQPRGHHPEPTTGTAHTVRKKRAAPRSLS